MRHLKKGRKFGRVIGQRRAFLKSLEEALILNKSIKTTLARAKELRPIIEKKITKAKSKSLSDIRLLRRGLSESAVKKLVNEIAPNFVSTNGGYTRIVKLSPRKSDGAEMAIIKFIK